MCRCGGHRPRTLGHQAALPRQPPRYVSDELAEFVDERLSMKGGPLKVYR